MQKHNEYITAMNIKVIAMIKAIERSTLGVKLSKDSCMLLIRLSSKIASEKGHTTSDFLIQGIYFEILV